MRSESITENCSLPIPTAEGEFLAEYSARGLSALRFPGTKSPLAQTSATSPSPLIRQWHHLTKTAVEAILAGNIPKDFPPLDLAAGTEFQRQVWKALRTIRLGTTRSYGAVAKIIGKPAAVRAVGGACGANPIPLLVPCHRVLAANQRIGGFSGGLEWKQKLLAREGVQFSD